MTDLDPEEFRRLGRAVVDWVAAYRAGLPDRPVRPDVAPGDVAPRSRRAAARSGRSRSTRCSTSSTGVVVPAIAALAAPGLLRLLPGQRRARLAARRPALAAGLGAQGMLWSTAPAGTEVEQALLDAARRRARARPGVHLRRRGRRRDPGLGVVGRAGRAARGAAPHVGRTWRDDGRRRPRARLRHRRDALVAGQGGAGGGARRAARCASVGLRPRRRHDVPGGAGRGAAPTTSRPGCGRCWCARPSAPPAPARSTRSRAIADLARAHGAWVHVDAAWAGVAALCPEHRRPARRGRAGRLVLHRRAQVAAHRVRRLAAVGARRPRAAGRAVDHPRVPAQRRERLGCGRRLPRLAGAARAPLPRPQAVGGAARLRAGRACARTCAATSRWPRELADRVAAEPGFALAAPPSLGPGVPAGGDRGPRRPTTGRPARCWRGQRVRAGVPHAHGRGRPLRRSGWRSAG